MLEVIVFMVYMNNFVYKKNRSVLLECKLKFLLKIRMMMIQFESWTFAFYHVHNSGTATWIAIKLWFKWGSLEIVRIWIIFGWYVIFYFYMIF